MITAFIGVIGSGKDYRAEQLEKQGHFRVDFKDALVDMVSDLLGYNIRTEYDWFKSAIAGVRRPLNPLMEGMARSWMDPVIAANPDIATGRKLLQRMGTEVMRSRDAQYWAKQYAAQAKPILDAGNNVVTADCRFLNEVGAINHLDREARFVFCDYRSSRYSAHSRHPSESMAQALLSMGYGDGDEIKMESFVEMEVSGVCK